MPKESLDILLFFVVGTISSLVISVLFVRLVYRYQKHAQQKQAEYFNSILAAQENERKVIAKEIHDGLGGILGSIKLRLSEIIESDTEKTELIDSLEKIKELNSKAIAEARNASNALVPEAIKRFGLKGAISDLAKIYESHFEIHLLNECPEGLTESFQLNIYRILNELFSNALKYSEATIIELDIIPQKGMLYIHFGDNGKGFNFDSTIQKGIGNGLRNIKSRVDLLMGSIETLNGKGAVFNFIFPL